MAWIDNFDLNSTATIYQITNTSDGKGEITKARTSRGTISCAVWQAGANETILGDKIKNISTHVLACEPDSAFISADEIDIGSDTYKVHRPDDILAEDNLMIIGLELVE